MFPGYLISQLVVLALQLDGEGRVICPLHQHRPRRFPDEGVASAGPDAVETGSHVDTGLLGDHEHLSHG